MTDPVEIMAAAIDSLDPLYESEPVLRIAVKALEASGFRIIRFVEIEPQPLVYEDDSND